MSSSREPGLRSLPGPALTTEQLAAYRAAVLDVVDEVARVWRPNDPSKAEAVLVERLSEPALAALYVSLPGGTDAVTAGLVSEVHTYTPSERSSASDLPSLVRIHLLSQIDTVWWGAVEPFAGDAEVTASPDLVDLDQLQAAGRLNFQYRSQPDGLPGRARDWVRRRALPGQQPHTAGVRFARARAEVVAALNQLASAFAARVPPQIPRLWVTSLARSVQHQKHLRTLGYAAVLPSAHCVGYACDVEMQWFRRFEGHRTLGTLLLEYQDAGRLNVIDEGQAWHLCVNPAVRGELRAAYSAQMGESQG